MIACLGLMSLAVGHAFGRPAEVSGLARQAIPTGGVESCAVGQDDADPVLAVGKVQGSQGGR